MISLFQIHSCICYLKQWYTNRSYEYHTSTILVHKELQLDGIALLDTRTDLCCMMEGLIPFKYYEKILGLRGANNKKLLIKCKLLDTVV